MINYTRKGILYFICYYCRYYEVWGFFLLFFILISLHKPSQQSRQLRQMAIPSCVWFCPPPHIRRIFRGGGVLGILSKCVLMVPLGKCISKMLELQYDPLCQSWSHKIITQLPTPFWGLNVGHWEKPTQMTINVELQKRHCRMQNENKWRGMVTSKDNAQFWMLFSMNYRLHMWVAYSTYYNMSVVVIFCVV